MRIDDTARAGSCTRWCEWREQVRERQLKSGQDRITGNGFVGTENAERFRRFVYVDDAKVRIDHPDRSNTSPE
jgi:hypothetical protein